MSAPIQIRMGGYGPPTTGFSKSLRFIGDRLEKQFGPRVDIKYVFNIMDLGYKSEDILWLVEHGLLTLGYQSASYLTDRVPELGFADLPFLFSSNAQARAAMDGALGDYLVKKIEDRVNYRILGWFENGFRHISNRLHPIRKPEDMKGLRIRALDSAVQVRTLELLGSIPFPMGLPDAIKAMKAGEVDAQENPFANTVTYGVHQLHKFHTASRHFYISRGIFVNREAFESWPRDVQQGLRDAVKEAVAAQRGFAVAEEEESRRIIEASGGEVIDLTPVERAAFVAAVQPVYDEARKTCGEEVFSLLPRAGAMV